MNNFTEEVGYIAAHRILEKNKVNAIIATDDLLGFGVQRAIEELGYKDILIFHKKGKTHPFLSTLLF